MEEGHVSQVVIKISCCFIAGTKERVDNFNYRLSGSPVSFWTPVEEGMGCSR